VDKQKLLVVDLGNCGLLDCFYRAFPLVHL